MKKKAKKLKPTYSDIEMLEWTKAQLARAELAEGDKVLREASGTLTRPRGRPKKAKTKELVRIRLSPEVTRYFRSGGRGWQTRIDEALQGLIH